MPPVPSLEPGASRGRQREPGGRGSRSPSGSPGEPRVWCARRGRRSCSPRSPPTRPSRRPSTDSGATPGESRGRLRHAAVGLESSRVSSSASVSVPVVDSRPRSPRRSTIPAPTPSPVRRVSSSDSPRSVIAAHLRGCGRVATVRRPFPNRSNSVERALERHVVGSFRCSMKPNESTPSTI